MKRIYTLITALALVLASHAQDNKPTTGNTGLGFSLSNGLGNRIYVSRVLNKGLEVGLQLGLNQSKSKNSQTDSASVQTDQGNKMGLRTTESVSPSMSITLVPFILKHQDIASNLDAFWGIQVPISFGTSTTSTTNIKTELTNYSREIASSTTQPGSKSIGVNAVFGCQWFFFKNLGMGAICGLGFSSTGSKGDIKFTQTTTNSGSLNTSTTNSTINTISIRDNKSTSITSFNNTLGFFLIYYL